MVGETGSVVFSVTSVLRSTGRAKHSPLLHVPVEARNCVLEHGLSIFILIIWLTEFGEFLFKKSLKVVWKTC